MSVHAFVKTRYIARIITLLLRLKNVKEEPGEARPTEAEDRPREAHRRGLRELCGALCPSGCLT